MNRRAPLFAGIGAGAVALLAVVVLLLPKISAVHKTQNDLTAAQQQEQTLRAQLGQLQQARRDAKAVQKQLETLQTEIPPTADLPSLIRLLQGAANAAAVDFLSVSPGQPVAPVTGSGVSTIPTSIQVTGSFFSVEEFLFRLEQLPRAVKVTGLTINASAPTVGATGTAAQQELSLSMTAEVYTTDASAGPGSIPGPTSGVSTGIAPAPVPSTSPGATPSASPSTGA